MMAIVLPPLMALAAWTAAGSLLSPARRALQPHHLDWLTDPARHGIRVRRFACMSGNGNCLLVEPDARAGPASRGSQLRDALIAAGVRIRPYGISVGVLVLLHGRTGRKEDLLPIAERFAAAGFRCLIPDLPAHGDHRLQTARFGSGAEEAALAGQVLQEARALFGLPEGPAGLFGLSMGSAYAIRAASLDRTTWKALVVASGFDALDAVLSDALEPRLGRLAPVVLNAVSTAARGRNHTRLADIRPAAWAQGVETPVMVLHGEGDSVVPVARGWNLYRAFPGPNKRWISVPQAGHHNLLVNAAPLYPAMAQWYLRWMDSPAEN